MRQVGALNGASFHARGSTAMVLFARLTAMVFTSTALVVTADIDGASFDLDGASCDLRSTGR